MRNKLLERNLLNKGFRIGTDEDHLFIPIEVGQEIDLDFPVVEKELEKREESQHDYRDMVDVPGDLKDHLPSSYDIIGDIAILKIPEQLYSYKGQIGRAIIETHKNVKTVLEDEGVKGDFRIRNVSLIAGEDKTSTVHREYGVELEIDLTKVYFSPRLATERWRVTQKVKPGDRVFDMFAGVGPYTVLVGKKAPSKHVYSVDINPDAVELLRKNIERNGIASKVSVHEGDAAEFADKIEADRVIMNLPHDAFSFIGSALKTILDRGEIHYYDIIQKGNEEEKKSDILKEIEKMGYEATILDSRTVKTYSADQIHVAFDIEIQV